MTAACGNLSASTTTTVASQPTPISSPIPTPHQITEAALEEVIYKEGDLPAVYSAGQVTDVVDDTLKSMYHDDLPNIPRPDIALMRKFEREGEVSGRVVIFVYISATQRDQFYQWEADDVRRAVARGATMPTTPVHSISNLGDEAVGWFEELRIEAIGDRPAKNFDNASVTFKRCGAVVDMSFIGNAELDTTISYAKRIDKRLQSLLCQ